MGEHNGNFGLFIFNRRPAEKNSRSAGLRRTGSFPKFLILILALALLFGVSSVFADTFDLSGFVTGANIKGVDLVDGEYQIKQGVEYNVHVYFSDLPDQRFDAESTMTYTLPDGFYIPEETSGTFKIRNELMGIVLTANYTIHTDRTVEITIDPDQEGYTKFITASTRTMDFGFWAQFDGSEKEIEFTEDVKINVDVEPGTASVKKEGWYNPADGKVHYTVTVNASGLCTNVNVFDEITGSALTFDSDSVIIKKNGTEFTDYTDNDAENGFDFTFDELKDGDVITIEYLANVDYSFDTDNDGYISGYSDTGNKVTVTSDNPDNVDTAEKEQYITYKRTGKSGEDTGETVIIDGKTYRVIEWTVKYNEDALASVNGDKITDKIKDSSKSYMKFDPDAGITVKKCNKDKSYCETETIAPSVLDEYSETLWTYTIPDDGDDTPYSYEITTWTIVDMDEINRLGVRTTVSNTAQGGNTGEATGGVGVDPDDGITVEKSVSEFNSTEVTWLATIHVPASGLAKAEVKDTFPSANLPLGGWETKYVFDKYQDNSLEISGLSSGEYWKLDPENPSEASSITIKFYYTDESGTAVEGLKAVDDKNGRDIIIKLTTEVDQEWHEAGLSDSSLSTHRNTIEIKGITDTAEVVFSNKEITKKGPEADSAGNYILTDVEVNTYNYTYEAVMDAVNSDTVTVTITYDPETVELLMDWQAPSIKTNTGSAWGSINNIVYTSTGVEITFNVPADDSASEYVMICTLTSFSDDLSVGWSSNITSSTISSKSTIVNARKVSAYKYDLLLTGVSSEELTITENFDTSILTMLTGENRNGSLINIYGRLSEWDEYPGSLKEYQSTDNGAVMTFIVPKNGDTYYPQYRITYYLEPDLDEIQKRAASSDDLKYEIVNNATWDGIDDDYTVTVSYDALDKELTNINSVANGSSRTAEYKITYNPQKAKMYEGGTVVLRDRLTPNQSLDYTSVEITAEDANGNPVTIDYTVRGISSSDGYDAEFDNGTLIEFTIPDETSVVITYDALILGSGNFEIHNIAETEKHKSEVDQWVKYGSSGGGSFVWPYLKVVKVDAVSAQKKLANVEFYIWKVSDGDDPAQAASAVILTTDENGVLHINNDTINPDPDNWNWELSLDTEYYLREVNPPKGYASLSTKFNNNYRFKLVNDYAKTDYENYVYFVNGDSFQIKNNPRLSIEKQVISDVAADLNQTFTFRITALTDDGAVDTSVNSTDTTGDVVFVNGVAEFELKNNLKLGITDLPENQKYKVEELSASGSSTVFTTTITYWEGNEEKTVTGQVYDGKIDEGSDYNTLTFINTAIHADATAQLAVKKTINTWPSGTDSFTFKLVGYDEKSISQVGEDGMTVTVSGTDTEQTAVFDPIAFSSEDVANSPFTFIITEVLPCTSDDHICEGVEYDPQEIRAEVVLAWDETDSGKINVTVTGAEKSDGVFTVGTFTNTYSATGDVTFKGTKTLEGRAMTSSDVFTFEIAEVGTENTWTVNNSADGTINYPKISYTLDDLDEHTYTVKETTTSGSGIIVDTQSYTVTVNVSDNGDGTLDVSASSNAESLDFVNTYGAAGSVTFAGTKKLEGRDLTEDDVFTFQIMEETSDGSRFWTAESDADGKINYPTITYTIDDVGSHTYTVSETITDGNGIKADTRDPYTVTVEVESNGSDTLTVTPSGNAKTLDFVNTYTASGEWKLKAYKSVTDKDGDTTEERTFTFALKYGNGSDTGITGTVTLNDGNVNEAIDFYQDGSAIESISYDLATLADMVTKGLAVYNEEKADWTITYELYEDASEYTDMLSLSENVNPIEITVTVTDNGKGKLDVTSSPSGSGISFTNVERKGTEVSIKGKKVVDGREKLLARDVWTFELEAVTDGAPLPEKTEVTNSYGTDDGYGEIKFGPIEFDAGEYKPGSYTYKVTEAGEKHDGITNDPNASKGYEFTVTLAYDDNGDLVVTNAEALEDFVFTFTNTYEASGKVSISVSKEMENWPNNVSFDFTLAAQSGDTDSAAKIAKLTTTQQVTRSENEAVFGPIEFELSDVGKTFKYVITEAHPADAVLDPTSNQYVKNGITYSNTEKTVEITLRDNYDGTITPIVNSSTEVGEDPYDAGVFTNTLGSEGSVTLAVTKKMSEISAWPKDHVFQFDLVGEREGADAGEAKIEKSQTATEDSPTAVFETINFTTDKVGSTYAFVITENIPCDDGTTCNGITYDETEITVTVELSDGSSGEIEPTVIVNSTEVEAQTIGGVTVFLVGDFINDYEADGTLKLSVEKTITDWPADDVTFSFTIEADSADVNYDAANDILSGLDEKTVDVEKADDSRTAVFKTFSFTLDDAGKTYKYIITEDVPEDAEAVAGTTDQYVLNGVTYNNTPIELSISLEDDGAGHIIPTVNGEKVSDSSTVLNVGAFENTYEAEGEVILKVQKSMTNWPDGVTFEFTLEADLTDEVTKARFSELSDSVKIDDPDDPSAVFEAIEFTQSDGGKSYKFIVTEVIPEAAEKVDGKWVYQGVTYTDTPINVSITVTDSGAGTLSFEVTPAATVEDEDDTWSVGPFVNTYGAEGTVQFAAEKSVDEWPDNISAFTFRLEGTDDASMAKIPGCDPENESTCVLETTAEENNLVGRFPEIPFDLDDDGETYNFKVYEVVPEEVDENGFYQGVTYDGTVHEISVTLRNDGKGGITAEVTGAEEEDGVFVVGPFENSFTKAEAIFEGEKDLQFYDEADEEHPESLVFTYKLYEVTDEGNKLIETVMTENSANESVKTISFTTLNYYETGDHTYLVEEEAGAYDDIYYDSTIYTVTVSVTMADGELVAEVSDNHDKLNFTNFFEESHEFHETQTVWYGLTQTAEVTPTDFFHVYQTSTPYYSGTSTPTAPTLVKTGFSSRVPTVLSEKPQDLNYRPMRWLLEIPSLSLITDVVEVPNYNGEYPVSWLGESAGLLEGYALPGQGRSILSGHNHLNTTEAGPFAMISWLEEGDRIFALSPDNEMLIFQVYANEKISETDFAGLDRISGMYENSLTLITCEDETINGNYANRRIIAAKPVE